MTVNNFNTQRELFKYERLKAAMKYNGITVTKLSKIIGRSPETVRQSLDGVRPWSAVDVIRIYEKLGLNSIQNYFGDEKQKGIRLAMTEHGDVAFEAADTWEIPHGAEAAARIGDRLVIGTMVHACYPPVIKVGDEYHEIKPGDRKERVIVLGKVVKRKDLI